MTGAGERGVVIVAEPDRDLRALLGAALGREGFDTELHSDAASALEAGGRRPPALYLFDIELPDLSGIEACRVVKQSAFCRPVLITDAGRPANAAAQARAAGADALLSKPFTLAELAAAIRRAVID